jgi:hypothetical protein
VTEALRSGWISSAAGRFLEELEARWAAYRGREHGCARYGRGEGRLKVGRAEIEAEPIVKEAAVRSEALAASRPSPLGERVVIALGANPLQLAEALGHSDRFGRPDPTLVRKH